MTKPTFDITKHSFTSEREGEFFDKPEADDESLWFLNGDVVIQKCDVVAMAKHFGIYKGEEQ